MPDFVTSDVRDAFAQSVPRRSQENAMWQLLQDGAWHA